MRISDWSSDVCSSDLMWKTGRAHPASSNMMKYVGTELNKRRHELVMSGGGSDALEWDSEETKGGARARGWLRTKANSIEGGTSEVMLNVIAKRNLDLPGAWKLALSPSGERVGRGGVSISWVFIPRARATA